MPFAQPFRQFHHARQNARRLHHGHAGSAAESVFAGKRHHEIERLVEQARERMRRVEPQRGEDGQQLAVEIAFNPGALLLRPLAARIEENALLAQRGNQLLVEQLVLLLNQFFGLGRRCRHGFGRRGAVIQERVRVELAFLLQPGHAHFEKFV